MADRGTARAGLTLTAPTLRTRGPLLPPFPRLVDESPFGRYALPVLLGLGLAGAAALGWTTVWAGPVLAAALLVALGLGIVVVSDVRAAAWATVGVIALLPFATLPFRVGLTLTLFQIAALVTIGLWLLRLLLRRDERVSAGTPALWIVLLLAVTLFAFLLGLGRGYTTSTFHNYAKFVLAILLVFPVWNVFRSLVDASRLVAVLLAATSAAATVGLGLYLAGPERTEAVLARLIPFGYPSSRIVRFIEDDPAKPMRLVSTSVDPNSFGGLLAVVFVIACAQAVCRHPVVPRWLALGSAAVIAPAMLLTYSRGAWVAAAAGLAVLALLRYRWLILPGAAGGLLIAAFGFGAVFIERMWLGLTLQDPATQLRLAEYRNALAIIREHPAFGVGFGDAPSIELQTGVSSIYLTIAQQAGLLGLAVFLIAIAVILLAALGRWRSERDTARGDLLLALSCAMIAALTVGLLDHYFFNITFPHMAGLFWIVAGLMLAQSRPPPGVETSQRP